MRQLPAIVLSALLLAAQGVVGSAAIAARVAAPERQATPAKPAQDSKQKKPPSAQLAEPWPDEAKMAERRAEAQSRRLFQQSEPLVLTLAADFRAINRDREPDSKKTFPAVLTATGQGRDGAPSPIPVKLRTRGNIRLNPGLCSFAPLAIDFTKKEVKGTVFDGQNKMKLVTHCQDNSQFDQYVLREYLIYRLHNLITPWAFRVRLARITYVDAASGRPVTTRNAILIEDEDDLAARMEGRAVAMPRMQFKDFDQDALTLMMLFQYMIGNTDFSLYALHNAQEVVTRAKVFYPIIWDFDITGLTGTPYGVPDKRLEITSVRERVYRGPCRTMAELEPSLAILRAKRAEAMALADLPGLDDRNRRDFRDYLGEFFTLLGRPDQLKRKLVDECKKLSVM